ncbi:type II pantothenate kinase [Paenibacillus sp. CF384]|uniref:type II pantothenate kinase n=1 Tax=Paenibacillus sp. CF384 TaxID=1884382 RepID=UPI0008974937|nr:type II pantothenate kinase [Paenibacillus sp. CF384]SDX61988.1 pantothenate kinase [Paenibacillus sp. CF384]
MVKIGVDAGGTLIKLAYTHKQGEPISFRTFPALQPEQAVKWIQGFDDEVQISITGGKASLLQSMLGLPSIGMVEFEATCSGVRYLLRQSGVTEEAHILTNVGTGTSIHYFDHSAQKRLGGTGVGGGTLMGLSQVLTGITDYHELIQLAAAGDRDRIDLKVKHIYQGAEPPIPGDLTASNFGRVFALAASDTLTKEELLASVVGLVGETVATASVLAAAQYDIASIIFVGSSFIQNDLLKEVVEGYTRLRGATPLFIENGEFSGAIGALLQLSEPSR